MLPGHELLASPDGSEPISIRSQNSPPPCLARQPHEHDHLLCHIPTSAIDECPKNRRQELSGFRPGSLPTVLIVMIVHLLSRARAQIQIPGPRGKDRPLPANNMVADLIAYWIHAAV